MGYSGILAADEDGRDIGTDHPIDQSEGCRYVTTELFYGALTWEIRNCGEDGCVCPDHDDESHEEIHGDNEESHDDHEEHTIVDLSSAPRCATLSAVSVLAAV